MFGRIVRLIKSWIGYFVSFAEDPEVMLHQAVEEMRNTVPKLNGVLVSTRATALKLESDVSGLRQQEARLTSSIKAALRDGTPQSRSIAEDEASTLQQVRESLANTLEQLAAARVGAVETFDDHTAPRKKQAYISRSILSPILAKAA